MNNEKTDLSYWLAIHFCSGLGLKTWQKAFGDLSPIEVLENHALIEQSSLPPLIKEQMKNPDWKKVEETLCWQAKNKNCHIITMSSPYYPALLKEIASPPLILYLSGNINVLANPQIAMVGSRKATPNGQLIAKQFARNLSKLGLTITSGLALGIDAASHLGCLSNNGTTIAVLGTGIDQIYPKKHSLLAEEIIKNGCLLSEFPLKTMPLAENFPRRNRIISGLSYATLVIEAALNSGSLITAKYALEQNREVLAIPGSICQPQHRGCHALIKQGGALIETINDILDAVPYFESTCNIKKNTIPLLEKITSPVEKTCSNMLQYVAFDVTPIDVIIQVSGLDAGQVNHYLIQLELDGFLKKVPGGYIKLVRNIS